MKYKRVQINITEEQDKMLDKLKELEGRTRSYYVRKALKNFLEEKA